MPMPYWPGPQTTQAMDRPLILDTLDAAVDRLLLHASPALVLAAPLGLGKPHRLLNAITRRIAADPARSLHLLTALSLTPPAAGAGLQKRFLAPFLERQFGADFPRLDYALAMRAGTLPANIRVEEFYMQSGAMLRADRAQRDYVSLNYTHVARAVAERGANALVQKVAREPGGTRLSLSCNPDLSFDLLDEMARLGRPRPLLVAEVDPHLPWLDGPCAVAADFFDVVLDLPGPAPRLFALPREPVNDAEFALGLHASTLVRDGGTLQIGIGALSDALVHALLLRQRNNVAYRELVDGLGGPHALVARVGGLDTFVRGLYGASEMVMDGFMHLVRGGILKRRVFDDFALEQALAEGVIGEQLKTGDAERLYAGGALPARIDSAELARLMRAGVLPDDCRLDGDSVVLPDGARIAADLSELQARAALGRVMTGRRLRDGRYLRGAFYLGSNEFYRWLGALSGDDFDGLSMTRVSDINQIYGGRETLDALQRREARFFNTTMMATALGAAASDALADGRVVSGVGGQYNFVAMAHALRDGRSALLLRSTRESAGVVRSNILWNYGHTTIPRHLRDVYVTEYGIADLRGRSDEECVQAMLAVTDARFLDWLVAEAQHAGKLARDFRVPDAWRANTPERIAAALAPYRARGLFDAFPFGSDFTADERRLLGALQWLKRAGTTRAGRAGLALRALGQGAARPDELPLLERMGYTQPQGWSDRLNRRLVLLGLRNSSPL